MLNYNEESKSYRFSLFGNDKTAQRVDPNLQDIVLLTDFKILQEAEFHDEWFCEHEYCENTFWLGGKHHCRMCGNTVCSDHCVENVVLSTRTMPVLFDNLPNATRPILAANKEKLPETLEFKRACIKCYNLTRIKSTEELQREKEERRGRRAERKRIELEQIGKSLVMQKLLPELRDGIHTISDKSTVETGNITDVPPANSSDSVAAVSTVEEHAVSPANCSGQVAAVSTLEEHTVSPANPSGQVAAVSNMEEHTVSPASPSGQVAAVSNMEEAAVSPASFSDPPVNNHIRTSHVSGGRDSDAVVEFLEKPTKKAGKVPAKPANKALDLLEKAAAQLKSAQLMHSFVLQEKERRHNISTPSIMVVTSGSEALNPETSHESNTITQKEAELAKAQIKASANIAAVLMKRNKKLEQAENAAIILQQATAATAALCNTTVLIFTAIAKRKAFQAAVESNDEITIQVAAADLIAQSWRAHVAHRRRNALQRRRRAFLERISACRIQSWIRAKFARQRIARVRHIRASIAAEEMLALQKQQDLYQEQVDRLKGVFLIYIAKRRYRQRLHKLPRIVVIDRIAVDTSYSSQQVLLARQSGCTGLESLHGSARNAVIARSKTEALFKTKEDVFASNTVCHERCLLTSVTADSTLCVTLLNPTSFVQSLVNVRDHMTKLNSGRTATVSPLPVEAVLVPTLDSSGKSAIPVTLGTTPDDHPGLRYLTMKAAPYAYSHAGYVSKQTHSLKGEFKERYLVLVDGKLWLFKDALSLHEPKDSLLCANIKVFNFGHDKSAEGKLTVHLSDGKEDWYLRFPNTDRHTSSVECPIWLRKIQYACPHTRLNGCAELEFVQLLERMGSAEGAPVLRPSTQGKGLTYLFGSFSWHK